MRLPAVHWEHSGLTAAALRSAEEKLSGELARMRDATGTLYDDDRGSINLPLDKHHLRTRSWGRSPPSAASSSGSAAAT